MSSGAGVSGDISVQLLLCKFELLLNYYLPLHVKTHFYSLTFGPSETEFFLVLGFFLFAFFIFMLLFISYVFL